MLPRRTILTAGALLLAGAVVNVAVAWGIAAVGPAAALGIQLRGVRGSPSGGIERVDALAISAAGRTGSERAAAWRLPMDPPGSVASTVRAGFGYWLCLEADFTEGRSLHTVAIGFPAPAVRTSWPDAPRGWQFFAKTGRQVPWQPFLPGFLTNTLIYAAILALPLSVFPVRRRLRARRGRCPRCNYDRTGINPATPCPECGASR